MQCIQSLGYGRSAGSLPPFFVPPSFFFFPIITRVSAFDSMPGLRQATNQKDEKYALSGHEKSEK